jgi:hypothetical protein
MAVTPPAQIAEFLNLGMCLLDIIFHGQTRGIVNANVAAQTPEDAADLESKQFGVRAKDRQFDCSRSRTAGSTAR